MIKQLLKENKGQSLVEMALVLPILIFLLLGIMEGGRIFAGYLELQNAARDGVRHASVQTDPAQRTETAIKTYVKTRLSLLDEAKFDDTTLDLIDFQIEGNPDKIAKLTLRYPMEIMTPLIGALFPDNTFQLQTHMEMRSE